MSEVKIESVLNPDSFEWAYGRRELKTLLCYPLAIPQQIKLGTLIGKVIQDLADTASEEGQTDVAVFQTLVQKIQANLGPILAMVADIDENDSRIDEIANTATNLQFLRLAEYIWNINFGYVQKNGQSLIESITNRTAAEPAKQA